MSENDTLSYDGQGLLSRIDDAGCLFNLFLYGFWVWDITANGIAFFVLEVQGIQQSILRDVENDGTWASVACDVESACDSLGNVFRLSDLVTPFGNRLCKSQKVGFLKGIGSKEVRGYLCGDDDDRGTIHHCIGDTGYCIGSARS